MTAIEFVTIADSRRKWSRMAWLSAAELSHSMAGVLDICSNHGIAGFTPGQLRELAIPGDRANGSSTAPSYRAQALAKRLEPESIADIALVRLLRDQGVVVSKRKVSDEEEQAMARKYGAGATMRELEKKFGLSHGAVLRALHRSGTTMRAKAPRGSA